MKKSFFLLLILFNIFCLTSHSFASQERYEVPIDNDPSQGPSNAPVTMIKFLDYQ